ncbi:bifunctional [glutamine synthetase] adenylyltransferase/[glutamine synthetase]-adenylyl-L-tyrosine phosphorylase [Corynebacterium bovis]|uniref:bifunctional [glutamine synthetase] adenylyltransferase/[glutamine synthetase]-adenylyl-L-tyrosine phosphorylase n=1 Tax=Corynebacterium bovis TaxID=36808 RepID=UPI00163A20CD|nr:bifunctional [glutamine synthetase] adenylyltransferase/[glutamine synthetase]-adenylyl-L-tyrosine phosphorylase [Corynebacterium bovis]
MNLPRSSRNPVPSPAALGLSGPRAAADLDRLGWNNAASRAVLWTLSATGDPNLALNNLVRLVDALDDLAARGDADAADGSHGTDADAADGSDATDPAPVPAGASSAELLAAVEQDPTFRVPLFALLGASTALGDHLVANPTHWPLLREPLPDRRQMMDTMLDAVGARPVTGPDGVDHGPDSLMYRAAVTGPEADQALRVAYRSLLMRLAAADLAGTFIHREGEELPPSVSFELLTRLLADLADAALTAALAVAVAVVVPEGDVPVRLGVLALGKCGARELNYISDVDVIFVAEPADAKATRLAGEFISIGCRVFFEVDAALRPEGKRGALVRTLDSHVAYYDRWAKTWEFQAQLKARPMTGDMDLCRRYTDALSAKVWTAAERDDFVEDVQAMRRRVIDNVPDDVLDRELKLGPGGLRDVEFAVQLLQMVHGRVDESVRVPSTIGALRALVAGGYVGREDGDTLISCYEFMRLLEHRMQLHHMRRTHTLPKPDDGPARTWLARTAGIRATDAGSSAEQLDRTVRRVAVQIHQLHRKLFYRPLLSSVVTMPVDALRLTPDAAKRQLAALGYRAPDRAFEHLSALASGSTRKDRIQGMILPSMLEWLSGTVDPDSGLLAHRKLSEAAFTRSWFLRLLRDENVVGQRLMRILGTSPYAAELIIASPDTVRLLSDGANGPKLLDKDASVISHSLVAAAGRHDDPDRAIAAARSLRRTELARIASADLLGLMEVEEVCRSLSYVWNAVLEAALQVEVAAWEDSHGRNAPARISVIGMGRLGGEELGYGSDADVLFVCEPCDAGEEPDREDTAAAVRWATGICDGLRRRLARPSQDPPLEVDVNLRPEGRNGPTVRTLESYRAYYARWADTWELQALLRATWIAGDKDLGIRFLRMIDEFRYPADGADEATVREVRRMKARVDAERLPRGADRNTHTKLGRGALTDIEWTVQLLTMQHSHVVGALRNTSTLAVLREILDAGLIGAEDAETLRTAWITATHARNAIVLVKGTRKDQLPQPGPQLVQVAAAANWPPEDSQGFLDDYLKKTRRARRVVDRIFWGEEIDEDRYRS